MRQGISLLTIPVLATAALTARRGVSPTGGLPAAGGRCLGPVTMDAAIGARTTAVVAGTEPWEAGGTFAAFDKLQVDAAGRVVVFGAGVFVGIAQEAAVIGQFPEVLVVSN